MKRIAIVCDGSSLGNGSGQARAAAAAIVSIETAAGTCSKTFVEYLGNATNNQAEIVAAAIGLEALREPCEVVLSTDSKYVVETMGGAWARKSNHDLWARLERAAAPHRVTWRWVRGHNGHPGQEAADRLARETAAAGAREEMTAGRG